MNNPPVQKMSEAGAVALPQADQEALKAAWTNSLAPNTRRAYRASWAAWVAYAGQHKLDVLPAAPVAIAAFLVSVSTGGASTATVAMRRAAISKAHHSAGHSDPTNTPEVKQALRGINRTNDKPQKQAAALDTSALATIRGYLNGRLSGNTDRRASRTMAICSVLSDSALRRSEAAALVWSDIEFCEDGTARITVRRSKTDQTGEGAVTAITRQAAADLHRIRGNAADNDSVFGVSAETIHRTIKQTAAAAGLAGNFSGHSGRVGCARRMTRSGAPMQALMNHARWTSPRMPARYTKAESAGAALEWLE